MPLLREPRRNKPRRVRMARIALGPWDVDDELRGFAVKPAYPLRLSVLEALTCLKKFYDSTGDVLGGAWKMCFTGFASCHPEGGT